VTKQLVLRRLSRIMYEPSRRYPSEFDHFHYSRHLHPQIPHGSPNLKKWTHSPPYLLPHGDEGGGSVDSIELVANTITVIVLFPC